MDREIPGTYAGSYTVAGVDYPLLYISADASYVLLGQTEAGAYTISNPYALPPPCYLRGTRILTRSGEVAVEALAPGDMVATRSGGLQPVRWIGRQSYAARFLARRGTDGLTGMPVRIRTDMLANGVPARDLLVSPDHALLIDGLLVTARDIVDGIGIVQEEGPETIDYFHVDIGPHDCLLAEGAWAESYAEQDNRHAFLNAADHPDAEPVFRTMCAPRARPGDAALERISAALAARTDPAALTGDAGLHLLADGRRVDRLSFDGRTATFRLAAPVAELRLMSRAARPRRLGLDTDDRALGFFVHALRVEGNDVREIDGDCPELTEGFHDAEQGWRWTTGSALLPAWLTAGMAGEIVVTIEGRAFERYPIGRAA